MERRWLFILILIGLFHGLSHVFEYSPSIFVSILVGFVAYFLGKWINDNIDSVY